MVFKMHLGCGYTLLISRCHAPSSRPLLYKTSISFPRQEFRNSSFCCQLVQPLKMAKAAGMKQSLQTRSWTMILPAWKVVGASSVRTGRWQGEGCRAVLWLSKFTDWDVKTLCTWYLLMYRILVQHLLCAPWGLEQISGLAKMTQWCCCNVPPQQHEVPNARNSFPVAQWPVTSGQGRSVV